MVLLFYIQGMEVLHVEIINYKYKKRRRKQTEDTIRGYQQDVSNMK